MVDITGHSLLAAVKVDKLASTSGHGGVFRFGSIHRMSRGLGGCSKCSDIANHDDGSSGNSRRTNL